MLQDAQISAQPMRCWNDGFEHWFRRFLLEMIFIDINLYGVTWVFDWRNPFWVNWHFDCLEIIIFSANNSISLCYRKYRLNLFVCMTSIDSMKCTFCECAQFTVKSFNNNPLAGLICKILCIFWMHASMQYSTHDQISFLCSSLSKLWVRMRLTENWSLPYMKLG